VLVLVWWATKVEEERITTVRFTQGVEVKESYGGTVTVINGRGAGFHTLQQHFAFLRVLAITFILLYFLILCTVNSRPTFLIIFLKRLENEISIIFLIASFYAFMAVTIKNVFWDGSICRLVDTYRRFRRTCCLCYQGRWIQNSLQMKQAPALDDLCCHLCYRSWIYVTKP
jgi:hypothetical protein